MKRKVLGSLLGYVLGDTFGTILSNNDKLNIYNLYNMNDLTYVSNENMKLFLNLLECYSNNLDYDNLMNELTLNFKDEHLKDENLVYALESYKRGIRPLLCGYSEDNKNNVYALRWSVPLAFVSMGKDIHQRFDFIHNNINLTDANIKSMIAVAIYDSLMFELLIVDKKEIAFKRAINVCNSIYDDYDLNEFMNIISKTVELLDEDELDNKSSDIVKTLEIVLNCFLNSTSFKSALNNAAKFDNNKDLIMSLVGGLAGAYYGNEVFELALVQNLKNDVKFKGIINDYIGVVSPFKVLCNYIRYFEAKRFDSEESLRIANDFIAQIFKLSYVDYNYSKTIKRYNCSMDDHLDEVLLDADATLTIAFLTGYVQMINRDFNIWKKCLENNVFLSILKKFNEFDNEEQYWS